MTKKHDIKSISTVMIDLVAKMDKEFVNPLNKRVETIKKNEENVNIQKN